MNPFIKPPVFTGLLVLVLMTSAAAQSPYPSLSFARELNEENTTDYLLKPSTDEIQKRLGGSDKPYRIVGVLARPSKQAAVLLFVNAQKDFQLILQTDKTVVVTVDAAEISSLTYEIAAKSADQNLKIEIGNILIRLTDLRRIAKGKTVKMKLGALVHQLDADNLAALRHLIDEIDNDEKKLK